MSRDAAMRADQSRRASHAAALVASAQYYGSD